ncbi:pentapeptide repeat-containing protein [Embleya sp. NPDC020886]|uniref:pentapeptide repeat-containing protein n=1 Tax=Embleya sp. NPDC020886 TaxID=3363980 RepID=UPI0037B1D1A2
MNDPVGCRGIHVTGHTRCLAHLDPAERAGYLASLHPGAHVDHRGTTFTTSLLDELLDVLRSPPATQPEFGTARFDEATFATDARFDGASFTGRGRFNGATFTADARFVGATFTADAEFAGATFTADASFESAIFTAAAWFDNATLTNARFDRATFTGDAHFTGATFGSSQFTRAVFTAEARFVGATFATFAGFSQTVFTAAARFGSATFAGDAWFADTAFTIDASFLRATFANEARFDGAVFSTDAGFVGAAFTTAAALGPFACRGCLDLSNAVFTAPVTISVAATSVVCVRTRWESTAALRLRYASVDLTDAVVTQPVAISTHHAPLGTPVAPVSEAPWNTDDPGVRVLSLRGIDAAHLVLTDTDLTECEFTGAFHLDQLRLTGRTIFARPPIGAHWRFGVPWRWTGRRVLAEEHHWRATRTPPANRAALTAREWTPSPYHHPNGIPGPDDLAPVYRDLRKAFEDGKNEPGAADFYYGEMSMRRHDHHDTPRAERALITAYWALSGYGLRATRALSWLLLAMTATVLATMLWGLPTSDPEPRTTGTLTGQNITLTTDNPDPVLTGTPHTRLTGKRAEKATRVVLNSVVFRSSGQNLTTAGTYIEMTSRLLEPVLLGLSALAIRGRVKR